MPPSRRRANKVEFVGSFPVTAPVSGLPEVAFAGRSNVGKSSAINAILGRKSAARVSRTPGRTQAVNLFRVNDRTSFADLPGYGFARVPPEVQETWKALVEGYLAQDRGLRLVVVLVDGRLPAQPLDQELLTGLADADIRVLVVVTKMDRVGKAARFPTLAKLARGLGLPAADLVPFSAVSGEGVAEVWAAIDRACR